MSEEKFFSGEREIRIIDARFREIYRYAKIAHPLPEEYINNVEIRTHGNLIDTFARLRKKDISKETFETMVRQIKKAHFQEYRDYDFYTKAIKEEQKRYMLLSQAVAGLIRTFARLTDYEKIDNLLKIVGFVFTPAEERVLREELAKSKEEKKERRKKTGTKSPKAGFDFEKIAKEYFKDEYILSLLSQWYENRKAKKNIVNTENAIRQNLKRIPEFSTKSGLTIEKYLEEVVRLGWAAFYPVDSAEAKPKASKAQSVFGADASYDLEKFDKNIVGMKYLDEETAQ